MAKRKHKKETKLDELKACLSVCGLEITDVEQEIADGIYHEWKLKFLKPKNKRIGSCDFDSRLDGFKSDNLAIDAFDKLLIKEFYVREGLVTEGIVKCKGSLPKFEYLRKLQGSSDFYFFDKKMNWCMIITHESEMVGDPFFIKLI